MCYPRGPAPRLHPAAAGPWPHAAADPVPMLLPRTLPGRHERWQRSPFLLREERLQDMPGNRRSGDSAVPAMLHEYDSGDLRVIPRREEYEPPVVPQILVGPPLRRFGAFEGDDLGGARLARNVIAG